jgi:ABC-type sugar transport system permease subunit
VWPIPRCCTLAGLQTIDNEIYEAAAIDGVNAWQNFWQITFPLIGPFFTINMVLSLKNSLGAFDQVMALTKGGPDSKTETVSYLIFQNGLGNRRILLPDGERGHVLHRAGDPRVRAAEVLRRQGKGVRP